jgi:hypothetical protein
MTRTIIPAALALLAFGSAAHAQGANDEALRLATELLTTGSQTFDTKDVDAMVAFYSDDAEVQLITRQEGGGFKVTVYSGKDQVRQLYTELFKDGAASRSKNTVETARMIKSDVLAIQGSFRPDVGSDPVPFHQVRTKRGEKWLIFRLQLFVLGEGS